MDMPTNSPEAQPQGGELLHWRFKAGVEETMCGLSVWVAATLLPEAATCPRCKAAFVGYKFGRADLPRATADGPSTTYKDKRRLTDAERFKWRKVYNDYTFSNCDHEHDGYPCHLVCAECAFELVAHFAATPRAIGETTVEAALAVIRVGMEISIRNAKDEAKSAAYRLMMEHFAEAGRQIMETIEDAPPPPARKEY